VSQNKKKANRHLVNSFTQFKEFVGKDFIAPIDITENFCKRFRQFLLNKYTGETPGGYYAWFKWVLNAATSDGYFQKAVMNRSRRLRPSLIVRLLLID
jgi:hypothetical protein